MNTNFEALLHSPEDLAKAHYQYAKEIVETDGLDWPIPEMNKRGKCLPLRPGKMATITGRPGMGKSTFLGLYGRYHAKKIQDAGKSLDEAIVHVTWEQTVEELESFYQAEGDFTVSDIAWGDVSLELLKEKAAKREMLPVWMIGHSVTKKAPKDLPRMTLDIVLETVELMEDKYGIKPKLLLMDYIQIIPVARAKDRIQQVAEVAPRVKEVAARIGVPAMVAVQASRDVDDRDWKLPRMQDNQWSSGIEQAADAQFAIWRPWKTNAHGTITMPGGKVITVTPDLFILGMNKQRGEEAGHTWPMSFDPSTLELRVMELNKQPPRY